MEDRAFTPLDRLLSLADQGLRSLLAPPPAARPSPAGPRPAQPSDPRHVAGLMRVNHAGEIAAQGLYQGQALVARDPAVREQLLAAARDEGDHLAWCRQRLDDLDAKPSRLDPLWYSGSVAMGIAAGLFGDRVSLGFVAETERQVEGHLDEHLQKLPADDAATRAVLEQMQRDEVAHGRAAQAAGGAELPALVRGAMRATSKVMTRSAYWV